MSREAIDQIRQEIDAAWLRSDADGITRYLSEDAVLMPPHTGKQLGRQQINDWLSGLFEHFTMTELAMPERELTISGDLAVERSVYEWTLTPRDGSEPIHDQANWIGIWRQSAGGEWSEVCGIWNSTLPAPAPAQPAAR
ncbi:MAG TPA: DUF4440 domain-containing protein [Gemmatimonadales bacterium]|jgi:uncharacterized protein (TIGR02246 family)|nr:DUF4440 domain-containing protein [Gemmatimonadales bacterium]